MGITWGKTDNDYTAKVGEYELVVMSSAFFENIRWVLFKNRHTIRQTGLKSGYKNSISEAKAAAEKAYFQHINK